MMLKPKVYVSGQYSQGDPCENTYKAIQVGTRLLHLGFCPFIPHLTHLWHTVSPQPYETWMDWDLQYIPVMDAILRLEGYSPGGDREVARARELGIPVFFTEDDLINHFSPPLRS